MYLPLCSVSCSVIRISCITTHYKPTMPEIHATDMRRARALLGLLTLASLAVMFIIPWTIEGMRQGHLGNDYEEVCDADGRAMYSLRCFRDIGFETFSNVHDTLAGNFLKYYLFASIPSFSVLGLFAWMVFRIYTDFKATLVVSMFVVQAVVFLTNAICEVPPPAGFVQLEPEFMSFFMGLVTLGNYGVLSMRATMVIMLFYDVCTSVLYARPLLQRVVASIYTFYCCMFLLCTHQMYTFSIIFNVMLAFSAHHMARTLAGAWEEKLQKDAGIIREEDAAKERTDDHFSIHSDEEQYMDIPGDEEDEDAKHEFDAEPLKVLVKGRNGAHRSEDLDEPEIEVKPRRKPTKRSTSRELA